MVVEPVLLNSTPALVGAVIGGGASLAAAVYTQWYQDRRQRIAREAEKREAIYGEFIISASKVLVSAYISDKLLWTGDEQHLIGLVNRMRLFAPPHIIAEAEDVIRNLIQIALQPRLDMQELARTTLTDRSVPDLYPLQRGHAGRFEECLWTLARQAQSRRRLARRHCTR